MKKLIIAAAIIIGTSFTVNTKANGNKQDIGQAATNVKLMATNKISVKLMATNKISVRQTATNKISVRQTANNYTHHHTSYTNTPNQIFKNDIS
jgi:hypothetical protein